MAFSQTLSFPGRLHSLMSTHVIPPSLVVKPLLHSQVKLPSLGLYIVSFIDYESQKNPVPSVLVHWALESQWWSPVLHSLMSWQVIQLFVLRLSERFLSFYKSYSKLRLSCLIFHDFFWKSVLLKPVLQTHAEINSEPFSTVVNTASAVHLHLYLAR